MNKRSNPNLWDKNLIYDLRVNKYLTYRQIQEMFGVSQHAVQNAIRRFTLPPARKVASPRKLIVKTPREYYEINREEIKSKSLEYYYNHQQEILARLRLYGKRKRTALKVRVFSHYSNGKPSCAICRIADLDVLCIDHLNGDGGKHRKSLNNKGGSNFYKWLRHNNYPDGYQVLCANCNLKKQITQSML